MYKDLMTKVSRKTYITLENIFQLRSTKTSELVHTLNTASMRRYSTCLSFVIFTNIFIRATHSSNTLVSLMKKKSI